MRLRIGERTGLRTQAADAQFVDPAGAAALRSAYRSMRRAGMTATFARSTLNVAYAVGNTAGMNRLDEWYDAQSTPPRHLTVVSQ